MFKEYYKNPKATKETFDEEGYMMTGDIGYYDDDKCFYIVDRIKEMFKFQSWHVRLLSNIIVWSLQQHYKIIPTLC